MRPACGNRWRLSPRNAALAVPEILWRPIGRPGGPRVSPLHRSLVVSGAHPKGPGGQPRNCKRTTPVRACARRARAAHSLRRSGLRGAHSRPYRRSRPDKGVAGHGGRPVRGEASRSPFLGEWRRPTCGSSLGPHPEPTHALSRRHLGGCRVRGSAAAKRSLRSAAVRRRVRGIPVETARHPSTHWVPGTPDHGARWPVPSRRAAAWEGRVAPAAWFRLPAGGRWGERADRALRPADSR